MTSAAHSRKFRGTDPRRTTMGWVAVVAFHLFVGWALVTGTARKGLELIKKPMEAAVIQEVIIPPPPPPPPPPKKIEAPKPVQTPAPPPPYVPPPEVAPPATTAPVIQSIQTPPPAPPVIAPPPPPAPPAPAAPVKADLAVTCPTRPNPEMPRQAIREGITGDVSFQVTIKDGVVRDVTILSGPRVFHSAVRAAVMQYKCNSSGETTATGVIGFKLE